MQHQDLGERLHATYVGRHTNARRIGCDPQPLRVTNVERWVDGWLVPLWVLTPNGTGGSGGGGVNTAVHEADKHGDWSQTRAWAVGAGSTRTALKCAAGLPASCTCSWLAIFSGKNGLIISSENNIAMRGTMQYAPKQPQQ